LPFAPGEGGERLAEAQVPEPDVGHPGEDRLGPRGFRRTAVEEPQRLGDRHREHLADVPPPSP
jgi:hypothetical protein